MTRYDILIKNGTVFDGKGNEPEKVDIGIVGDEIKKIGDLKNESADKIIDATDKYVTPGFIDLTNHSDTHWTLFSHPSQESLISQGITTILGGNCGTSLAPFLGQASLEEIRRWTDVSGININWQTVEELLSELEKTKISLNFGTLVGLNTLLVTAENDLKKAEIFLEESLGAGAFGFSSNLSFHHTKSLDEESLLGFFKIAKSKNCLTKHHLEDEGENILPALARLISLARKSGAVIHITHFKALGKKSWEFFPQAIEMIKRARDENLRITCDFFPYTKTGSNLFNLLPPWIKKMENSEIEEILQVKKDKRREDLLEYLRELTLHFDKIIIASAAAELGLVGKTIEKLTKTSGLSGEEIILNLLATNNLRVSIFNEVISAENIELIAKENFSVLASDGVGHALGNSVSDGNRVSLLHDLPHPRSFGAFPRAINLFVKEKALFSWEEMVYKMTGLAAETLGLKNRGFIENGNKADIVVFSPEEISDKATYENPFQYSRGVKNVLVNGVLVLDEGKFTQTLPGYILRKK